MADEEQTTGKKVLLIEDEDSERKILAEMLRSESIEVLEASDGIEGLYVATEHHPDLIVLDIMMPKMDGMTMLNKLRADVWGVDVPVLLLTNLSDSQRFKEGIESGVYDYLVKSDWKVEDIVRKIKEKLDLHT